VLLRSFDLLQSDPLTFLALLGAIIIGAASAVTVHEASHAWTALQLGDRTAYLLGRVTLNPKSHLDPAGSVLFLLVFFGWGKPTPVNPANFRGDPRSGMAATSAAGPLSNIATAMVLAIPFRLGILEWRPPGTVVPFSDGSFEMIIGDILAWGVLFNSFLAIFNLIPLPPLDGYKVALGLLPAEMAKEFSKIEWYGMTPFMALIFLEFITPVGVLSGVVVPIAKFVIEAASGHTLY
jgi:Zn-dependent protease